MKLKVLFNGFRHGHVNGLYKKALTSEYVEIAGCIEPNIDARTAAEASLGATFSDEDYDWWLASDIDVVAVGTAYGDRGDAIIKALSAGKHVIADKPICTDIRQLEQISALCVEKNLKLICMLDLRYLPQSITAKKLLNSGRFGQVRNVMFNGQHCLNYGSRPGWYFEKGMHGGTINDLAIHGVDLVHMLTGMAITKIDAARTWNSYAYMHPEFKDCALFMARLNNGAGVIADISYSAPKTSFSLPSYWEFRFWCDKGMLEFNYNENVVTVYESNRTEPEIICCSDVQGDYMDDLYKEIVDNTFEHTRSVMESTLVTLMIQRCADKEE